MIWIIVAGFVFGFFLQTAKLNKFDTISGMATLEDYTVAKAILFTIGLSAIIFAILFQLGLVDFHVKPLLLTGIILGGVLFGAGMAVLGYCPGTMAVSAGEGAIDAIIGIVGGLLGGFLFTVLDPALVPFLGANEGKQSVFSALGNPVYYLIFAAIAGAIFMYLAFYLDKKYPKNKKWLIAGTGLALMNTFFMLKFIFNRPIGASTAYPYLSDAVTHYTSNAYFEKIQTPGSWELYFLIGAVLAGLVFSLINKSFNIKLIFSRWATYKGVKASKRITWAFVGGFFLIFGARMAGGCTSGHIISGGMQLAFSSLLFGLVVFATLLLVGKLFYKTNTK